MVCKSECDKIHIRMRTVKELYDSQQTVIETAKEAQKSSELTALLDYKAQVCHTLSLWSNSVLQPLSAQCRIEQGGV